jgi:L-arabinose isomerase
MKIMSTEKVSTFIERYTKDVDGKKSIDLIGVMIELHARIKTQALQIKELQEALGDYANFMEQVDKRLNSLEGKKTIISLSDLK